MNDKLFLWIHLVGRCKQINMDYYKIYDQMENQAFLATHPEVSNQIRLS